MEKVLLSEVIRRRWEPQLNQYVAEEAGKLRQLQERIAAQQQADPRPLTPTPAAAKDNGLQITRWPCCIIA